MTNKKAPVGAGAFLLVIAASLQLLQSRKAVADQRTGCFRSRCAVLSGKAINFSY